jgi:hypothetical protein
LISLQVAIEKLDYDYALLQEDKRKFREDMNARLQLGRHIYLPEMECVIVHSQISCFIRVGGYAAVSPFGRVLGDCQPIRLSCHHIPGRYATTFVTAWPAIEPEWIDIDGVYMGSFVAQRIQRAWRGYMVCRRRMALCMASNPRLGAGASPLLGAVIRVLCVEDLVRIV